jgi:hypothetical protein
MYRFGSGMFLVNPFIYGGGGVPFDPDALAFITAASITDPTQQSAVNQLVLDLKTANIWTKMKAVYPFVGGTATAHKWNLKDPRDLDAAYRLSFSGGWTHSATGALPNGSNAYADTFVNPSIDMTQNNASGSVYLRTNNVGSFGDFGVYNGTTQFAVFLRVDFLVNSSAHARINTASYNGDYAAVTSSTGLFTATRTGVNVQKIIQNGVVKVNGTLASVAPINGNIQLSCHLDTITGRFNFSNRELAFSCFGEGLNDTEAASLSTAVQNYQTTLSRQV